MIYNAVIRLRYCSDDMVGLCWNESQVDEIYLKWRGMNAQVLTITTKNRNIRVVQTIQSLVNATRDANFDVGLSTAKSSAS